MVGADHATALVAPFVPTSDDLANETSRVNEKGDDAR